jgi:AcrR family transcriptional regulator
VASRRERQAAATRQEIGAAARRLFARHGYAGTSMAAIAREAGVSVQTIYDSIGSKATLVAALNDLIDEEAGVAALAARIPTTDDPVALLDIAVSISHNVNERCADIAAVVFSGAAVEPALAAIRDEGRRRHRNGIGRLVARVVAVDGLRPGVETTEAADVIAVLTDPQVARTFVVGYGWTWRRWHEWTLATLVTLLLR